MQIANPCSLLSPILVMSLVCWAHSQEPSASDIRSLQPGHSVHSHAFNEGPRQAAYLMPGMGNVHWKISSKSAMAQRFFDQGIAQLHGFWYFEAERSFRQAAAFDPDCAILYWGMARANIENEYRSKGFIEQAMQRLANAPEKEKRLIEAWNKRVLNVAAPVLLESKSVDLVQDSKARKAAERAKRKDEEARHNDQRERLKQYVADLETIATDFPDDIEIKAMLVLQYWQNDGQGIEMQSRVAINALLTDIFQANPRHPAHHFRIHLWDYRKENLAIEAAAKCGPSAPGIAHMWHMPGHTYARLHRYADAAWQQEASARVDHAHMMRDHVLPDQIHNYAHNNEWLVRDLMLVGRVEDAILLAKNMIELPRHPKFNMLEGRGSASLGRERLLQVLTSYRLWNLLIDLLDTPYLNPADDELRQDEHQAWMAMALCNTGDQPKAMHLRAALTEKKSQLQAKTEQQREALRLHIESESAGQDTESIRPPTLLLPFDEVDDPFGDENDPTIERLPSKELSDSDLQNWSETRQDLAISLRESEYRLGKLKQFLYAIDANLAAANGRFLDALQLSNHCRSIVSPLVRMEWLAESGHPLKALEKIEQRIQDGPDELLPLAIGLWIASKNDMSLEDIQNRAKKIMEPLARLVSIADTNLMLLNRLDPTVERLNWKDKWRMPREEPSDLGERPSLNSLGPFRWTPPAAPVWSATLSTGELRSSKHYSKRPLVLILYLGMGCIHCAEQLKEFSPLVAEYDQAGIDVIAISTETLPQLQAGLKQYDAEMKIPLFANPEQDIFKAFRCYDDFEGQPLHGTFLIDLQGQIRWQDTGHEPFMAPKFLLKEAARLLKL